MLHREVGTPRGNTLDLGTIEHMLQIHSRLQWKDSVGSQRCFKNYSGSTNVIVIS